MAERRRAQRQKSFLRGCVYFNKRRGTLDCLVRDFSEHGARVIFPENVSVPDTVELHMRKLVKKLRAEITPGDEVEAA